MNETLAQICNSPFFGISLSICCYAFGFWVNRKVRSPLANPLLIAILLVAGTLVLFDIPLDSYNRGGGVISMFLGPATAVLALTIYRQRKLLGTYLIAVLCGTLVGSLVSLASVWALGKAFGLDDQLIFSILPKSVTTPIAIEISKQLGGFSSLTVAAVVITGTLGNILAPTLVRLFKVKDPVAAGVGIGTCSHAVGTSKAIELGEIQGAMSGIALSMSGVITVLLALLIF
jgi:predicted murein hydrolase (TIGR00659 family)